MNIKWEIAYYLIEAKKLSILYGIYHTMSANYMMLGNYATIDEVSITLTPVPS